ncbi:MAG: hypothetical protein ABJE95_39960, partial [Byssovorax sp.]
MGFSRAKYVTSRATASFPTLAAAALALAALLSPSPARAWLLHEHVQITYAALGGLARREQLTLDAAWAIVRRDLAWRDRLCEGAAERGPVLSSETVPGAWCVGFSSLPALAGDHSCSPWDLQRTLRSAWTEEVLAEATRLDVELETVTPVLDRLDARRRHDIELQLLDHDYLTRATASNGAHFQLTRVAPAPAPGNEPRSSELGRYLHRALATGQEMNATALYVNYHAAAVADALRARALCQVAGKPCDAARYEIWNALTAEAFSLHFLEDAFSSGHFVGSWGSGSERFGTHDYYARHGVLARLFRGGDEYVAHGDLFLTDEDERRASFAAAESLGQVLRAMVPGAATEAESARDLAELGRVTPTRSFDSCHGDQIPVGLDDLESSRLAAVVGSLPMPGLRDPEMPRFRAEYGLFFGVSVGDDVALLGRTDGQALLDLRLRAALRVGYGLEGAMSRYMDGAIYAELLYGGTWRPADGHSVSGIGARLHLPFAILPGDGLLAPLLVTGWRPAVWIAKQAALGTIWGRAQRLALLGEDHTIQFCLGRDVAFLYYPGDRGAARDRRVELFLSAFNLRVARASTGQAANELNLDFGFQMILPG